MAPTNYREITACRSCAGTHLESVLDLGNLCVSDFLDPGQEPDRAPLELVRCGACSLVQLRHSVDRDRLYRTYHYRSGTNETMVAALRDVVTDATRRVRLEPGDWVLDVGCNDGTLLDQYPTWVNGVGFEPSQLAAEAVRSGAGRRCVVRDYFPPTRYPVDPVPCKVITACAVFYDLDDPGAFLEECKRWLHPEGVLVLQFQSLDVMCVWNAIDNVCHEHLTYWNAIPLGRLLRRYGLQMVASDHSCINGGSTRLFVKPGYNPSPNWGTHDVWRSLDNTEWLGDRVERDKTAIVALLRDLKADGQRVYGMAASTKFNTLSQVYGIGPDLIEAIGDRSPAKVGKYTVTGIPIVSEEEMRAARPDYLFVCAWGFADAFLERERALLEQGTRFIVPLPRLRVVGGAERADVRASSLTA